MSTNWTTMKDKPPINPKYIHVVPKVPSSGIKKAPMIKPITSKYFIPQNLERRNKDDSKYLLQASNLMPGCNKDTSQPRSQDIQLTYPFCIPARGSLDDFAPIIITAIRA